MLAPDPTPGDKLDRLRGVGQALNRACWLPIEGHEPREGLGQIRDGREKAR